MDTDSKSGKSEIARKTGSITYELMRLRALADIYAERGDTAAVYECQLEAWQLLRAMQAQVLS